MAEERKMTRKRSLINTYFTEELRVELLKITMISGAAPAASPSAV